MRAGVVPAMLAESPEYWAEREWEPMLKPVVLQVALPPASSVAVASAVGPS